MKNLFKSIVHCASCIVHQSKTLTLLLVIGLSVNSGWATTFTKITSTTDLTSGDKYLIVCESKNDALDGSQVSDGSEVFNVTIESNTIELDDDAKEAFTITGSTGSWKITGSNDNTIGHTGSKNTLNTGSYTNTITFSEGNVSIGCNSRTLKRNSSNVMFRYYSSGQTAIQLYKAQSKQALSAPSNLLVGTTTSTSAPVSWSSVTDAGSYKVEYKTSSASNWTAVSPNPTTTSCTITGLTPSSTYNWRVTAIPSASAAATKDNSSAANGDNFTTAAPAKHKVYFSANGTIINTGGTEVTEGNAINFPETAEGCDGKTFMGWYGSNYSHATDAPTYVTSAIMGGSDVTYYAVFADAGESITGWQLSTTAPVADDNVLFVGKTSDGAYKMMKVVGTTITAGNMTLNANGTVNTTFTPVTDYTWTASSQTVNSKSGLGFKIGNGNPLHINSSEVKTASGYTNGTFEFTANEDGFEMKSNQNSRWLKFNGSTFTYSTSAESILIFKNYEKASYSNYTTTCATKYSISADATNGSILWSLDGEDFSSTIEDQIAGTPIFFKLQPASGYEVDNAPTSSDVEITDFKDGIFGFTMPSKPVTISASFKQPAKYIIDYDLGNFTSAVGTLPEITEVDPGTNYTVDTEKKLTLTGYTFKGWNTNKDASEGLMNITVNNDITLYAIFTINSYNITFNPSITGGSIKVNGSSTSPVQVQYNSDVTITVTPTSKYFKLTTLTYNSTDIKDTKQFTMPAKDVTLEYAFTEDEKVTVTLKNNGNTLATGGTREVYVGDPIGDLPTLTDACDPHSTTFVGWTSAEAWEGKVASFDNFVTASTVVSGNMTLNAVWAMKEGSEDQYKRVKQLSELATGTKIVIIDDHNSKIFKNDLSSADAPNESNDLITITPSTDTWTLGGNSTDGWTLSNSSGKLGIATLPTSNSNNKSKPISITNTNSTWTIGTSTATGISNCFYIKSKDHDAGLEFSSNNWIAYYNNSESNMASSTWFTERLYIPSLSYSNYLTTCSSDPLIEVSPASLSDFSTIATTGNPSAAQSFTVEGFNLTANITVTAPAGYEVSLEQAGSYTSSVQLPQAGGTAYVRLAAADDADDEVTGSISITSAGATTKNINLTGEVIAAVTVTFNNNGTTTDAPAAIKLAQGGTLGSNLPDGGTMTAPITGYSFVGWVNHDNAWAGFESTLTQTLITGNEIIDTDITYDAVWAQGSNNYKLIDNPADFTSGNYIIDGYDDSEDTEEAMNNTLNSGNKIDGAAFPAEDHGVITTSDNSIIWKITVNNNTCALYSVTQNKYLSFTSGEATFSFSTDPVWITASSAVVDNFLEWYLAYNSRYLEYDLGVFDTWSNSNYSTIYLYKQQISNFFVTTPNEYTVTWHKGNAGTATTPAFEGQTFADIVADAPEVADNAAGDCANTFMGWATGTIEGIDADGSSVVWAKDNTTPISGNVDYYAVFAQAEQGESGTVDEEYDFLSSIGTNWTKSSIVEYFGKPCGIKSANAYIMDKAIADFSNYASIATSITIGVTSFQNGGTTSILTIYLVDEDGNTIGTGKTITPTNGNDVSSAERATVEFGATSGATGYMVKCTTYGKGILITATDYSIEYNSATYSNYVTQCTPTYSVNFYTTEETTNPYETQVIEKNQSPTKPTTDPSKVGCNFLGWSETWKGSVVDVTSFTITAAKNFFAKWQYITPTITTHPQSNTGVKGANLADLTVVASADGATLSYQWQISTTSSTEEFTNISGATSASYTPSTAEEGSFYYRCVVTNGEASATSNAATITVSPVTQCATPTMTIGEGTYFIHSAMVTLATETEGASIYYTTDGLTTPTSASNLYTDPFEITATTTIKAKAMKVDMTDSYEGSATFTKAELQSIAVKTAKTEYTALVAFDPTDLVITATYDQDMSEDVAYTGHEDEFSFNPSTPLNVTNDKVIIGWGGKETEQAITVNCIAIDAPAVDVSKQGSTGITLTWSPIDNAVSYQVKWNGGEAEDATSPYVKTGLTDNTNYTYEVIAVGETNYCTSTTGVQNVKTNTKSCVSIDNAQIVKTPADFYVGESIEESQFKVDKHYDNGEIINDNPSSIALPDGVANPLTNDAVGTQIVTLTFNHKTTTIEITVKPQPVVTWSINGNTDNKQSFAYNAALVLPEAPDAPQSCAEKTFVGWTTENYKDHDSDEAPEVLFTEAGDRKVTEDVTYYAVFAMVENAEINTLLTEGFDDSQTTDSNTEIDKNTFSNFNGNCSKAYKSKNGGVKLGSSSAIGYITSKELNLSKPTTITFDVKQYGENEKSVTVTIVNNENQSESVSKSYSCTTENSETAVLNFESSYAKALVKFTTTPSSHRIYFDNVKIEAGGETIITAYSTKCAARTPENIEITAEATTKTFDVDDPFTYEGLEITASYNTGNPQVVTDYCTITAPDMTTAGEKDVNISYTENDATVYTSYKINVRQPYYVMYESNGATGSVPSDTKKYYTGEKVTVLANESLVKTNNVFKGWSYAGATYQADDQITVGTEDITLTAVWEEKMPCTITLSENGNTSTVTDKFTGDNYTLPATITYNVDDYAFMGWSTQEIDDPVATTEQGTFFAKGEEITLINNAYTFYAVYARTSGTSSDYNAGKVTTSADIVAGGLYIFAIGDYAMNNTVESKAVQMTQNFAKTGLSSSDAIVFTLENATNGYYIKNSDGKYLHNESGTEMSLINSTTNSTAIWTFSYNTQKTSNAWQIQNTKNDNRFLGNPDASMHTVKAYATGNWDSYPHAITIYRLVGGYTTAPTITVNGTTVQTVPADFHGNVIVENGGDVTLNEPTTWKNLTIKNGGKVTTNAALTIKDLFIETKMGAGTGKTNSPNMKGACGQLIIGDGGSVTASGSAIIENQIDPTGTASYGWYTFSVPFPVSAQNGIYFGETKLTNGVDYAIMEYLGDVRAQGQYGWKKFSGILQPGVMYTLSVADTDYGKLRFKKTADGDLISTNSWTAGIYGGGEETDANWNAIGNPNLAISQFVNDGGVQTLQLYDHTTNAFTGYAKGELNIVVGSGFFIQAVEEKKNITMKVNETTSGRGYRAPAEEAEEKPFMAVQLLQGDAMSDQVFINADVNASLSYEIGRDVAKIFMQGEAKCAQIYVPAYGKKLCAAEFQLNSYNEAVFPLTITMPKAGTYSIAIDNVQENTTVYLTQDGQPIWNLTMGAYTAEMGKGTHNEYGLMLQVTDAQAPTNLNGLNGGDNAIKFFKNSDIYILRNAKLYNTQGQLVK